MHLTRRTALAIGASTLALPTLADAKSIDLTLLQSAMSRGRFVTYQPTELHAIDGKLTHASEDSIRADLKALRPFFDSLITYGAQAGAERIPDIAAELGFRAVVMGVWDFRDATELGQALAAAKRQPKIVAGLSLGNEMVLAKRASWSDLATGLAQIRAQAPALPLTVTEAFAEFLNEDGAKAVLQKMDFMLVNIHPIFENWFRKAQAKDWADFVGKVGDLLARAFAGPVLVKETGIPTGPASLAYTPELQRDFYRALEARFPQTASRAFSYFSAFDAPWRVNDVMAGGGVHPEEAHWGLFEASRTPKRVMQDFPPLPKSR